MTRVLPIPFTSPMVSALLDDRKTMTRRVLTRARVFATPDAPAFTLRSGDLDRALQGAAGFRHLGGDMWTWEADAFAWQAPAERTRWNAHVGYAPGDLLWVREAWRVSKALDATAPKDIDRTTMPEWLASDPELYQGRRRAGMHLPRWASRLTLEVTSVKIERLQDISEEDAAAEGCDQSLADQIMTADELAMFATTHILCPDARSRILFEGLWEIINGSDSWEANPWVTATTFTVHRRNVDDLLAERAAS